MMMMVYKQVYQRRDWLRLTGGRHHHHHHWFVETADIPQPLNTVICKYVSGGGYSLN